MQSTYTILLGCLGKNNGEIHGELNCVSKVTDNVPLCSALVTLPMKKRGYVGGPLSSVTHSKSLSVGPLVSSFVTTES